MDKILLQVKKEIEDIEAKGINTQNVNLLEKLSSIYANLSAWNDTPKEEQTEQVLKVYSNNTYDRNLNELYDAYVERRKLYQSDASIEHKETMLDALKRLMTEISDLSTLIWDSATFTEERDLISNMLEVIARH